MAPTNQSHPTSPKPPIGEHSSPITPRSQVNEQSASVVSKEAQSIPPDMGKCESWEDTLEMINEIIREHGDQPMSAEEIEQLRMEPGFDFEEDPFGLADYI